MKSTDAPFHQHQSKVEDSVDDPNKTTGRDGMGPLILEPEEMDILCSPDKLFSRHAGNQMFKELVATYASPYNEARTKQDKMEITKHIVELLEITYKARFLRPVPNGWEELSHTRARDKVSHALRWVAVGKRRTRRTNKLNCLGSSFDSDDSSSAATLSLELGPSLGLWEDPGEQVQQPSIELQHYLNNMEESHNVVAAATGNATEAKFHSEPSISESPSPFIQKPSYANAPAVRTVLSSFDEALTSSDLASLMWAPLPPDDYNDNDLESL